MATSLNNAVSRLEREVHDESIDFIELQGKFGGGGSESSEDRSQKVLQLTKAIQSYSCRLKVLSLRNNFLANSEVPSLIDAIGFLPLLEKLVVFHHDLGDDMVELLVNRLACSGDSVANVDDLIPGVRSSSMTSPLSDLTQLYLSHCKIGCKGAAKIADALVGTSSFSGECNRLKHLQVLSLGSNNIGESGALSLAKAFAKCPSLHRMVLHGNEDLSSNTNELVQYALDPIGWQQSINTERHATPMTIITSLVKSYVEFRWQKDHVLIRAHELARQKLLQEIYKNNSTFVDDKFEDMPELLSWMGRVGLCSKPPCQSNFGEDASGLSCLSRRHSYRCKECTSCNNIHLNDVYSLVRRMPHLVQWFRSVK